MNVPDPNPHLPDSQRPDAMSEKELLALQYLLQEPGFDRDTFEKDMECDTELMIALSNMVAIVEASSCEPALPAITLSTAQLPASSLSHSDLSNSKSTASLAFAPWIPSMFAIAASLFAIYLSLSAIRKSHDAGIEAIAAAWSGNQILPIDPSVEETEVELPNFSLPVDQALLAFSLQEDSTSDELPHWLLVAANRQLELQSEDIE